MKKYGFTQTNICLSLIGFSSVLFSNGANGQSVKPNIIFILADDLGYGDVSSFNENSKIQTTNIDGLAKQGVVFTDAHSGSAVCSPTRYGILTGRYNWRSTLKKGVLNGYSPALIPHERITIASVLREEHYQTACIGKWHLGWDWDNVEKGKDNLKSDPGEIKNLYAEFPAIVNELKALLTKYIKNGRNTPGTPQKNVVKK